MKRIVLLFLVLINFSSTVHSQVMISKLIGKNSGNSSLGYGVFATWELALKNTKNDAIRIELMDFAFYPRINSNIDNVIGYLSIKLGYKHVFSETETGFYIEPQAGWARVVVSNQMSDTEKGYGDGLALALEGGYSLAVNEVGNTVNFGLKYESDIGRAEYTANSIGFRVSYSFHFGRRSND